MSLCSRLIKMPNNVRMKRINSIQSNQTVFSQNREEFQNYFTDLMKSRSLEKTNGLEISEKSEEELLWQNELKGTFPR